MTQDNGDPLRGRATRASTEPQERLGHSAGVPIAWNERLLYSVGGLEVFARNWSWRSHSPTDRAKSAISAAAESLTDGATKLHLMGATDEEVEEWAAKAIRLWLAYQAAGGRTANPMITGPANFPVERNRKAMESERKRGEEYYEFVDGARHWLAHRARRAERAALSAEAAAVEHRTLEFPGVKLVQNTTLDRIQLVFDGKPDPETIALLKGSAFRWSPREAAWQRQNTNNGVQAAYRLLHALGHEKGRLAQGTSAGTAETLQAAQGDSPQARSAIADAPKLARQTPPISPPTTDRL